MHEQQVPSDGTKCTSIWFLERHAGRVACKICTNLAGNTTGAEKRKERSKNKAKKWALRNNKAKKWALTGLHESWYSTLWVQTNAEESTRSKRV